MSVDPKIAKSEMDNLDAALKKGAVTKSKVPSAAVPSGTGNELADIDALLKKKGVSSSSLSGGLSTGTEDLVESGNIEPKPEGDLSGGLGKGKKTEGKGLFEFMNNPTAVPKLPTEKINVQDFVRKQAAQLKADIAEGGKLIDPEVVKSVRDNDPETFKEIVSAVLPKSIVKNGKAIAFKAFPDEYLKSGAIINAIVGNVNDAANYNSFNKTFKETAGVDYSPEEAAKLSPAKRIEIGIAEPGDFEKARTEIFKEDLDQNFPKEKVPFGLEEVIGTQDKYKNEILSSPEKMAEYAVRRQQEEQQKRNELAGYNKQYFESAKTLELGADDRIDRDVSLMDPTAYGKYLERRTKKVLEYNDLGIKIQNLSDLAAKTIAESVKQNYLKENGITDPNSPQAIELLNTEKAWKNIGYNVAMKSDANLALHLEDIEAALADRRNNVQYSGGTGGGSQTPVTPDLTPLPTDWESRFKRLSESGNDIIQAQLINKGYTALIANLKENGKFAEANQLISKADEVAVLTGKAASGELWARLSAARFKKYGETIGRRDGWGIGASSDSPDKIRELAKLANFSTIDNAILEKYMIPDEFSGLGLLSNLQTSGFIDNTLEAIGGTLASVKNMFRDNADRTREILNDKSGKLADVGEYTPFLMELEQLGAKKSLTPQEAARKQLLTENTNLMNWWQQFKSVSGNTTGQVLGIALSAKGLDKVFKMAAYATMGSEAAAVAKTAEAGAGAFEKSATNIAENIFNQPSFAQKAAKYINNQKSLYISSFANSFDNYKKESLQLMPGAKNEGKRMVYSTMMATAEGLSESIFDDRKVLNAFGKEISPVVTSIVNDLSHGTLNKVAALSKLESVLRKDQFLPFIKKMVINAHGEAKEEFVMDVVPDIAKAILLDQDYDFVQSIAEGFKTYQTMFIGGLLTAGMATRGDIRNNTFNKSSLYRIANSPAEYHDEINRLTISGDITPQQAQVKHAIVNAASGIFSNMVKDGVVKKNGMNDAKNNAYLLHTLNENVNTVKAKATNDEIVKKPFLDAAVRSHGIREGIYNGMINVDEFINPTTPDEKLAEKLDIDFVPDQTELTQQEQAAIEGFKGVDFGKGGITNWTDVIQSETASPGEKRQALTELKDQLSDKNSEIATGEALGKAADFIYNLIDEKGEPEETSLPIELSTETPTQQSGNEGGDVKLDKPSAEQQLKDIQEGNMVTFEYKNESEVPEVFKDKISSKGEINGKPYVKVTMAKSLADFHLQEQSLKETTKEGSGGVGGDVESTTNVFNETQKSNPTVWQKIKDAFYNVVGKVHEGFKNTQDFIDNAINGDTQFSELAKALKDKLGDIKTSFVDDLRNKEGKLAYGKHNKDGITVSRKSPHPLQTWFHEAVHKLTVDKLYDYEEGNLHKLSDKDIEAIQNLHRIFGNVQKILNDKGIETKQHNPFKNVREFVAEALTNPEFQEILNKFKGEGKSPTLLKQFLDAVSKLLGLKDGSILDDVFHHTENLFNEGKSEQKNIAEAYHDAKSKGIENDFTKAVEQSLKETTKAEATTSNQAEIEAKKADIEKRKEELEKKYEETKERHLRELEKAGVDLGKWGIDFNDIIHNIEEENNSDNHSKEVEVLAKKQYEEWWALNREKQEIESDANRLSFSDYNFSNKQSILDRLKKAISKVYQSNRQALDEGFAEWYNVEREVATVGGNQYAAHGMGKTSIANAFTDLINLFEKGINPFRGQGALDVATLAGGISDGTTTGGAYMDGAFTLVANRNHNGRIENINQIGGIIVNEGIATPEVLSALKELFPNLVIESTLNSKSLVEQLNAKYDAELKALEQQNVSNVGVEEGSGGVGGDVVEPKSYAEATDAYKATELGSSEDAKNKKQALVEQAETEEGKKFVESEVSKLEKNEDGTITVFRSGTLQEGHNPATTSRKTAEIIAAERKKQGLSSDIVEVRVNPSDISVVVKGIESEVFVKVDKSNKERIDKNTVQKQKTKAELLTERDGVQKELEKTKKALNDSEKAFNDGTYPFSENVFKDANKKQKAKIKNLEWQLSKIDKAVEQSIKETTKAETPKEPKPKSAIEKLKEKKEAAAKEAEAAKPNVGVRNIKLKPQVELARVKDIDKLFAIAKNILDWKQDYKASGKSLNEYLVDKYNEAVAIPEEQRTDREQNIINAVEGKPIKKIKDEIIPKKQVAAGDTGKSDTESSEGTGEPKKIKTFKKRAKAKIKSPLFLKALDVDDTNPLIAALQYFISGGRIHYQALQKFFSGKTDEIKAHFQLVGKHGPRTTERLGEDLWHDATEEMQNKYDSTDFYSAVEQVLLEHNSRTTMAEEVLKISGESLEGEDKAAADWYNNQYEALPEGAQQELDNAIDLLQGLTDSEIQALVDADEEAFNNYIETESEKYTDQPTLEELMDDSEEVVQEQNNNEAEKEQIQKWLDDEYENNEDADIEDGHVSFDWDGEILEIFQGRNKPPLEFTKEELIEKGVFDTPEKAAKPEPDETPLEPVDAAKDLIRAYVLRGDSLQSLKEGQLGSASSRYDAHIGGYANGKKIKSDQIAVTGINNEKLSTPAIFSLKTLYDEIAKEIPITKKVILQQHEAVNQLSDYLDEIGTPSVNDKLDELHDTLTNLRDELKGVVVIVPYKDGYIVASGHYGTEDIIKKFSNTQTYQMGFDYFTTYYQVHPNVISALKDAIKEGGRFGSKSFVETDKNFKVIEIYKSDGVVPKLNEISNPVEPVEPEGNGIKKAQLELDRANAALKKAEDKIAEKQAKQLDLLNPEPMQADLFANNGDEVKAVLEPLKQRVREAKAALADAEKLQQDSSQPELFGDIGIETLKVKKNEPNNVVLKTKYSFAEGSEFEHGFTFTGKLDVQETVDQSKPFAVGYFGDNNANRYERAVASNNINDIVSRMKDFDSQEGVVEIYNPNTKEKNSFTIYPFANTYTDETVGLNNDQKEQKVKDAEKSKKISEIEKAKQDKINEVTRPELDIKKVGEGFPITDLAKTTEANRQKYNDLVQKMYSLKELINCLWK